MAEGVDPVVWIVRDVVCVCINHGRELIVSALWSI